MVNFYYWVRLSMIYISGMIFYLSWSSDGVLLWDTVLVPGFQGLTLFRHKPFQFNKSFTSINDLTVISEDEYYFTNDSAFNHNQGSWRMLEMMIPLNLGSIGYCKNGNNCKLVTSQNLAFPNGITWKKIDGRMKIYVTLYKGTEILIYKPDSKMNLQLFR